MRPRLVSLRVVRVYGPSMVPTLRHDDVVLVRWAAPVRPGDVVLASFRELPGHLVVKRAHRRIGDGWWLVSDNVYAGGDSAVHGVADVHARVVWRLAPGRPVRVRRGSH